MGLKIKWNDDRVRGTTTALLLICRDRLSRGVTDDLIAESLADYRNDPDGYKENKAAWPDMNDVSLLKNPHHVAYYKNLLLAVDGLIKKFNQAKRQFNSLTELDNYLVFTLQTVR
jgi:hypothetical protein